MEMINKELEIFGPKTEIENGFDKRVVDGYSRTYVLGFNKKTKSWRVCGTVEDYDDCYRKKNLENKFEDLAMYENVKESRGSGEGT